MENRTILGLIEKIKIGEKEILAKIDSGASRSSIHISLASELKLGPVIKSVRIKSSHGVQLRPVVKVKVLLAGREVEGTFTITNREGLKYPVLIGQEILKQNFLIDPMKNENSDN
ncbi:hypothetical protein HOD61_02980 [archaeon]|jgi:hypothetical protein|nr:hypothetical protein [archaeon]